MFNLLPVVEQLLQDFTRSPLQIRLVLTLLEQRALNLLEARPVTAQLVAHVLGVPRSSAAAALAGLLDGGYLVRGTTPDGRPGVRLPLSRANQPWLSGAPRKLQRRRPRPAPRVASDNPSTPAG